MTPDEKKLQKFELLLIKVFATPQPEVIDDQIDFDHKYSARFKKEYDGLMRIVVAVKKAELLHSLLIAYLQNYERNKDQKNNTRFYRSDETFFHLIQQSATVGPDKRIHFGETIDTFVQADTWIFDQFKSRIADLSSTVRSKVLYFFKYGKKKRGDNLTAIDLLKKAYEKRYGSTVEKLEDLYDFDPFPETGLKEEFDFWKGRAEEGWTNVTKYYSEDNVKEMGKIIDFYAAYVKRSASEDILKGFQLVKYFLDHLHSIKDIHTSVVTPGSVNRLLMVLYLISCKQVVYQASRLGLKKNRYWLTDQEKKYFTGAIDRDSYISNYRKILETTTDDRDSVIEQSKALVNMLAISQSFGYGLYLVDYAEAKDLAEFWVKTESLMRKLNDQKNEEQQIRIIMEEANLPIFIKFVNVAKSTVSNTSGPILSQGTWGVGSTIGKNRSFGSVTITHIDDGTGFVYIEFSNLKKQLFKIQKSSTFFADYAYGSSINYIYQSTIGIVYINQIIMMALPFLPVLIEGGFVALCYEIGLYIASVKVEELASKIDPTFGKLAGLAFQVVTPRPKGPQINAGIADDAVHIIEAPSFGVAQSFEERLTSALKDEPLVTDFNRGTMGKLKNKVEDTIGSLPEISLDNASIAAKKVTDKIGQEVRLGEFEPAVAGGPQFRVSQESRGLGTSGTREPRTGFRTNASSKLDRTDTFKSLDDYYQFLESSEAKVAKAAVADIKYKVDTGVMKITEAENKLKAVLNTAKEQTGEYVAESFIRSNFKVLGVVRIPTRGAGAPVLDIVFKVKGVRGRTEYILIEAKGGPRTNLGEVTPKDIKVVKGKVVMTTINGNPVKQASPEWYFQKIVEIYQSKGYAATAKASAALEREYKRLARDLLESARQGKVSTAIIKSGSAMDPKFRFSSDEFVKYFANLKFELP